jgi:3',5'-cyclic AMP phosphodiesterase CpdA
MTEFRLAQVSDTHLSPRYPKLSANFDRIRDHIDTTRPDLVVNTGDLAFDAPTAPDDFEYARSLHAAMPVPYRCLPGNHDIGDNPTEHGPVPAKPVNETARASFIEAYGSDRWRFDAAGWCFIGLNSLVMNSGLASEAEQFDWLASELGSAGGKPVALFLHKPVFLNEPEDPELAASAIRFVPPPARRKLLARLQAADIRLIASGHVHQRRDFTFRHTRHIWSPSAAFIISDARQDRVGIKQVGLVEYRFQPDGFEVQHVSAPGQIDVDLDQLLADPS